MKTDDLKRNAWDLAKLLFWVALAAGWAHSGVMCYNGEDYPVMIDSAFRPCGVFIIPTIAVVVLIFLAGISVIPSCYEEH